ncbi:MAG: hypothetical protein OYH77_03915, partial [Pseudomonadota bacterium]|nr:hypothetical protein [Pseudomonadota bacterium]
QALEASKRDRFEMATRPSLIPAILLKDSRVSMKLSRTTMAKRYKMSAKAYTCLESPKYTESERKKRA